MGGLMPGQVVDFFARGNSLRRSETWVSLPGSWHWISGRATPTGGRAVFARKQRERRYRAVFIDYGYCFHAGEWKFEDIPLRGVYYRNDVYREITGWESFEPWLTRLETMPAETVWGGGQRGSPGVVRRRPE